MSKEIDSKKDDRIGEASINLEETLRRIEPFIKKPVEEPRKRNTWVVSEPGYISQPHQITSKIISN